MTNMYNFLNEEGLLEGLDTEIAVDTVLNKNAQLPPREKGQEVGLLEGLVTLLADISKLALGAEGGTGDDKYETRISFDSFSRKKAAKVSFEDFRPNTFGEGKWHKVTLVTLKSEHEVFFGLLKKFMIDGLNINELLLLDNLVLRKWDKLSPEEQVLLTLILSAAFAAASGAKSFESVSKPLRRLLTVDSLIGLTDITARRVVFMILDLLPQVTKAERRIKLKFDVRIAKPTKPKPKKHVGVGYSDGLGSRQDAESLEEQTPDEVLPRPVKNPPDPDLSKLISKLKKVLPTILR